MGTRRRGAQWYRVAFDDADGVTHLSREVIEDFDVFCEYVAYLQGIGCSNVRVYNDADPGVLVMRFDDE